MSLIKFLVLALFSAGAALSYAADPFTVRDTTREAFSRPFPSLTREEKGLFSVGNSFFRDNWIRPGASADTRDGLGPTFNANTCSACHQLDGRGPGAVEGFSHVSLLFRIDETKEYGTQINPLSVEGVPREAAIYVGFKNTTGKFPDGETYELREPTYDFKFWLYGEPDKKIRYSARVGQQLIGLGLIERIPAHEIEANADPSDVNQDGISGRANYALNIRTAQVELGRFGWKAEQPTLEQQSAAAFNGDIGITTELFPKENCPAPQLECQSALSGGQPELGAQGMARLTFYMQTLAVPQRRGAELLEVQAGAETFRRIGCANCHTPTYHIGGVEVHPFTDVLLHDMGPDLADRNFGGETLATEWRTPPLWGIGLLQTVNGHTNLLHDGRARGVQEAILWHGGEAHKAREAYKNLSREERRNVVRFVESL